MHVEQQTKLAQLGKALNDATLNERTRTQQLENLVTVLDRLETSVDVTHNDFLQEDKLLSRIDTMESQLKYYMTRYPSQTEEMETLRQGAFEATNAKFEHEMKVKSSFERIVKEKEELVQKLQHIQTEKAHASSTAEVHLLEKEKEINDLKVERSELLIRFQELQNSALALTEKTKSLQTELTKAKEMSATLQDSKALTELVSPDGATPSLTATVEDPDAISQAASVAVARSLTGTNASSDATATENKANATSNDSAAEQIKLLQARLAEFEAAAIEKPTSSDQTQSLENRVSELELELKEARADTATAVAASSARLEASTEEVSSLTQANNELKAENERLAEEVSQLQSLLKVAKEVAQNAEDDLATTTKKMSNEVDELLGSLKDKENALADALDSLSSNKEKMVALADQATEAKKQADEAGEALKRSDKLEAEIARLKAENATKSIEIKNLRKTSSLSQVDAEVLQGKLEKAEKAKAQAQADLKAAQAAGKRAKRERSDINERVEADRKELKAAHQKLKLLERSAADKTASEVRAAKLQQQLDDATASLGQLKSANESLKTKANAAMEKAATVDSGSGPTLFTAIGVLVGSAAGAIVAMQLKLGAQTDS